MMEPIFEITMKSTNKEAKIQGLTVRVVGLERAEAVKIAERTYGAGFKTHFVIAGPRVDD